MGISGIPEIPMIITCLLQGTLCDTGIPCTFYGGKICSVLYGKINPVKWQKSHSVEDIFEETFGNFKVLNSNK